MTQEKPAVDQSEYSDDWIESAWGGKANDSLLTQGWISPRPRVQRAVDLADLSEGVSLLDIACGRAEVPAMACQRGGYGVGLDYSAASIRFAQRVKQLHEPDATGAISLTRADATTLPFADDSFDRVTMLDIIEHLYPEQLENMFREVQRVLKPTGYAVIHTLPNRWFYDIAYRMARTVYTKLPADPRGPHEKKIHINEQDIIGLHQLLDKVGLSHRIWLEQHIPQQARWNAGVDSYQDNRDTVYPVLARWPGKLLEAACVTPLKLLLCNDIFGLLWKTAEQPELPAMPMALTENLVCRFAPKAGD